MITASVPPLPALSSPVKENRALDTQKPRELCNPNGNANINGNTIANGNATANGNTQHPPPLAVDMPPPAAVLADAAIIGDVVLPHAKKKRGRPVGSKEVPVPATLKPQRRRTQTSRYSEVCCTASVNEIESKDRRALGDKGWLTASAFHQ
eukprot:TRINITY_DN13922_c0_g1_i5.p1 TRINITY_DN13922_c0_g1~~TRINITY_DN13922_c0_g1_i5.p1  ORF type:complete len:151 (-),score=31.22 TRINITY_DN13922_c0_g1_i5:682-1134(-)